MISEKGNEMSFFEQKQQTTVRNWLQLFCFNFFVISKFQF